MRHATIAALVLFFSSFMLFAVGTPAGLSNGDGAVYAQQIREHDFSGRTVHLGYYLIGSVLTWPDGALVDRELNLLSSFFGAGTVSILFLLTITVTGSSAAGLCASLILAANLLFFRNAVQAEVYAMQSFFLVLAFHLWLSQKAYGSGVSFAAAALVTPSTVLAGPAFIALRPRWRPLLRMGVACALVLTISLSWVLDDFLFGGRGLAKGAGASVDLGAAVRKEGFEVVFGFFALLPLIALGMWELVTAPRCRRYGIALAILWFFQFLLGERFGDVPVQLPLYALLAGVGGLGTKKLLARARMKPPRKRPVAAFALAAAALVPVSLLVVARPFAGSIRQLPTLLPVLCAGVLLVALSLAALPTVRRRGAASILIVVAACMVLNAALIGFTISAENRRIDGYRATVLEAGRLAAPDHLVVGTWEKGVLFEHYLYGDSYSDRMLVLGWRDGNWGEAEALKFRQKWRQAVAAGREIWLLDPDSELIKELELNGYYLCSVGEIYLARR